MMLGEIIERFEDEATVREALLSLNDLTLLARVTAAAADEDITVGEFAARSVGEFVSGATDESWLTVIGRMSRTDNPGGAFLAHVLSASLPRPASARGPHHPVITVGAAR